MAISKVVLRDGRTLIDLTDDTVTSENLVAGKTAHDASGEVITGTLSMNSLTANADEILEGRTARIAGDTSAGQEVTGTMPNHEGADLVLSDVNAANTIPMGFYDGSGRVKLSDADGAKLIGANIRAGITILGIEGTMTGGGDGIGQTKSITPTFSGKTVLPDYAAGFTHLSEVTVRPIPVVYDDHEAEGKGIYVTIGGEE